MMDYFYKLLLESLLLIGGVEKNPGPKSVVSRRRAPRRGVNNSPDTRKSQKQLNIEILQALKKIQQNQNEQKKQMRNFSRSLEEMKKIQQQCSDTQSDVQHKQQQLLESHQDVQQNFLHLPQRLEQLKNDILLPFTKQELQVILEAPKISLEVGPSASYESIEIPGLCEMVRTNFNHLKRTIEKDKLLESLRNIF